MTAIGSTNASSKLFLSWAHRDEKVKEALLDLFLPRLAIMKGISFEWWEDSQLFLGEAWRRSILQRLDECDYGLQLLTPNFFASRFITKEEIPPFVGPAPIKGALPVGVWPVPLDGTADLHGIDALQIFRLDGKSFGELTSRVAKDRFAEKLAEEIRRRVIGAGQWQDL